MNLNREAASGRRMSCAQFLVGLTLILLLFAKSAGAQTLAADQKNPPPNPVPEIFQTLYLTNATHQNAANDIITDLRNMFPRSKIYYVASQNVISMHGPADDMQRAQKMVSELDQPGKLYRLTYTITETDAGKRIATQHFALIALWGTRTTLRQGRRVPIVTGTYDAASPKQNTQIQYQDVGLSIEAILDGEKLHSKVEQSSLADERSSVGLQDPIVRQSVLDATSNLTLGKPVVLGSLDTPGSTRHQEIEVTAELVQ